MQNLTQQFLTFCRSKPREEEYDYRDIDFCACGQFFTFAGIAWNFDDAALNARLKIERELGQALLERPNTFGALADRLEAHLNG